VNSGGEELIQTEGTVNTKVLRQGLPCLTNPKKAMWLE
jgi:hypothetical protein